MTTQAQIWDCINEGGEGYRPDFARRSAAPKAAPVAGVKKYTKSFRLAATVQATLDRSIDQLANITDASAREIAERSITALRADLS